MVVEFCNGLLSWICLILLQWCLDEGCGRVVRRANDIDVVFLNQETLTRLVRWAVELVCC